MRKGRIIQTLTVLSASSRRRARRSCSLASSLGDGTADRQPDPPSSLEHLSCTSPSSLLLSSLGGVRQRHASCRDSVISNTAGDASAAAATAPPLLPLSSKTSGPRAKTTQRTLHCTGSSRDRTEQRDGGESDGLRRGVRMLFLDLKYPDRGSSRTKPQETDEIISPEPDAIHLLSAECFPPPPSPKRFTATATTRKRGVKFVPAWRTRMRNELVFNGANYTRRSYR